MYLNIMLTVIAAIIVFWFLYECFGGRLFRKPSQALTRFTGHSEGFFDVYGQLQAEFRKGNFQQVLELAETLLKESPYEEHGLSYKAYALFHQEKYAEAKTVFQLLDSLPNQDCTKMLDKINQQQ